MDVCEVLMEPAPDSDGSVGFQCLPERNARYVSVRIDVEGVQEKEFTIAEAVVVGYEGTGECDVSIYKRMYENV